MNHFINQLEIQNFKSIHHLEITGCKKINLFIGRPNVGKSNILEALSAFSVDYLRISQGLDNLIRLENSIELFHNGDFQKDSIISIRQNGHSRKVYISFDRNTGVLEFEKSWGKKVLNTFKFNIKHKLELIEPPINRRGLYPDEIRKYTFNPDGHSLKSKITYTPFLYPPFGSNLMEIIEGLPILKETFSHWFSMYGLRLVLDRASNSLKILKDNGNEVFIIPYFLIADTLQRIIFYKTAVASNLNAILIFEEPEAHAYPPYIAEFTQEVINSHSNQFFIATHSPIIVNDFLENARQDLAIFLVDYKNEQTVVKALSDEQIYEVYKYGVDLFFNNEAYLV